MRTLFLLSLLALAASAAQAHPDTAEMQPKLSIDDKNQVRQDGALIGQLIPEILVAIAVLAPLSRPKEEVGATEVQESMKGVMERAAKVGLRPVSLLSPPRVSPVTLAGRREEPIATREELTRLLPSAQLILHQTKPAKVATEVPV